MRRQPLYLYAFLLLVLLSAMVPGAARGLESQFLPPYELYRFHMGSTNGYFYSPWYQHTAQYYSYLGPIGSGASTGTTAGIYPNPQQGYTPDPASGLLPLYQWTVIEGFRSYIHLSIYYGYHGSNYHFNGITGYVYPASTTVDPLFGMPTVKVSAWYSQSRGYWYGIGEPADGIYEYPPYGAGYQFHGVPFRLPAPPTAATGPGRCGSSFPYISCDGSRAVRYDPPPACSDPVGEQNCYNSGGQWNPDNCTCTCNPWEEQSCYNSGGQWDSFTCTCNYGCNPRFEFCNVY
jgi:hypothetical protein